MTTLEYLVSNRKTVKSICNNEDVLALFDDIALYMIKLHQAYTFLCDNIDDTDGKSHRILLETTNFKKFLKMIYKNETEYWNKVEVMDDLEEDI